MSYVPRMVSLQQHHAKWIVDNGVNLSKFIRNAIDICMESDSRDIGTTVAKLRNVNKALSDLVAAYQIDMATVREDVR